MKSTPADVRVFLASNVCIDLRAYLQAEIDREITTLLEDTYIELYDIGGSRAVIKILKDLFNLEGIFIKQAQREAEEAEEKEIEDEDGSDD